MVTKDEISSILLRDSFLILRKEREIFIYILLSIIINIVIYTCIFLGGLFLILKFQHSINIFVWIILIILIRLDIPNVIQYTVSNFFSVAIISTVYKNIHGGNHNLNEGLITAKNNWRKVIRWSIFDKFYLIGIQIMRLTGKNTPHPTKDYNYPILIDPVWNIMKYLIPAIMIIENKNVHEAVERAGHLSVDNWRVNVMGGFKAASIGLGLVILFLFVLIVLVFRTSDYLPFLFGISFILLALFVGVSVIRISLFSIYDILCYHYSVTGEAPSQSILFKMENPTKES